MNIEEISLDEIKKILTNDCKNVRTNFFDKQIKSKYEIGIWLCEPDELIWYDVKNNYIGLIERNPILGNLTGYIGLPYKISLDKLTELQFFLEINIKDSKSLYIDLFQDEPEIEQWIEIKNDPSKDYYPGKTDIPILLSDLYYRDIYSVIFDIQYISYSI